MTRKKLAHVLAALPLFALTVPVGVFAQDSGGALVTASPSGETAWGIPVYDIPADADVRFGVLPNGMKYAIAHNETPENTAVVRFGFDVGWVDEREEELGLAHVIEHMAFNGSTNVPEGEMIKLLERLGLAFGADTNASTGFEDTIYKLDLPRVDDELVDTALMLMRETASEITIADEAVDRERGIIQSETRTRNNYQIRRLKDYFNFVAPNTLYAKRFRADGTVENIDTAPGSVVRDLYRRYYRPDNATLVVVGDVDPEAIEAKIVDKFSSWQAPAAPIAEVDKGLVDIQRGRAAGNFVDPDVPYIVTIDRFAPYKEREETIAELRQQLLINLGTMILNRRFQRIVTSENAPIVGGSASASDFFDINRQATMQVQAKEGEWQQALAVAEQEWRRAVQYGFTTAELAEQLANLEKALRDGAAQEGTRPNQQLADTILATSRAEDLFVKPSTYYELFERLKPELTADAVSAALADHYTLSDPLIHVSTKEPIANAETTILAAYDTSQRLAVSAPEDSDVAEFAYAPSTSTAKIVSDAVIDDLGIRTIRFANNVLLNLKQTTFEDDTLRYSIRVGSGQLAFPDDDLAEAVLLSNLSAQGGLGQHSFDELRQIFAGQSLTYGFNVAEDKFVVSGAGTMADLPAQMQLSMAYLTDPGLRPEMISQWLGLIPPFIAQIDSTPQAVAQFKAGEVVTGGNPRFAFPDQAELEAVSADRARELISGELASAPIEIAVVGEFDMDAVIAAVASTFGSLPARKTELAPHEQRRMASFTNDRGERVLTHAGAPDQALALTYWPTTDDADAQEEATLELLARILRLEMTDTIREQLGASYSPTSGSSMSNIYDGYGTFSTSVIVEPSQASEVFGVVDQLAEKLRTAPVDEDTLARARKPLLEQIAQAKKSNGWWLGVADDAQLEADRLDRIRTQEARYNAVTPQMLQRAAQEYLDPAHALRIRIVHESLADSQ